MKLNFNKEIIYNYIKQRMEVELKRRAPMHDGELQDSINGKIENGSLNFHMIYYWWYVENGSAPHWTSVNNLKKWCKDKWGDENLAYILQRVISKKGTRPSHFIKESVAQELTPIIAEALQQKDAITITR